MSKINLSKEKVKYVAIGDSISEGYNGKHNFGFAGRLDDDKNISGNSWPSFLARTLQKFNALESYENFALSGTRIEDWNYFLGVNEKEFNYERSEEKIEFAKYLSNQKTNPDRRRLKRLFNDFGKNNSSDFDFLKSKIAEANLITINIGANSLLPKIPVDEITNWIIKNKNNKKQIREKFVNIINSIEKDLLLLLNKIKEINKKANIYLISYTEMQGPFWELFNDFFKSTIKEKNILGFCIDLTNNVLKKCALKSKINFISTDNKIFVKQNNYHLYNIFYEIHPTIFGYKKMAQDIFIKMSLKKSFFKDYKNVEKKLPSFNKQYWLQDINSFENCLSFSSTKYNQKILIEKVYGKNDDLLYKSEKTEEGSKFIELPLFVEQSLNPNNDPGQLLKNSFKKAIVLLIKQEDENYYQLANDIDELFENGFFLKFISKTKFISLISNKIQIEMDNYYSKNKEIMSKEFFSNIALDKILDWNFIILFIKEFAKFWNSEKTNEFNKIKKTFFTLLKNLLFKNATKPLIENISKKIIIFFINKRFGIKSTPLLLELLEFLSKNFDIDNFSIIVFEFFFSSIEKIQNITSTDELIQMFITNNKIKIFIEKSIKKIIQNIKIDEALTKKIMNYFNIVQTQTNIKVMKGFFELIISILVLGESNSKLVTKIMIEILTRKEIELSLQNVINILLEFSDGELWNKIKNFKLNKFDKNKFETFVKGIDLIFNNMKFSDFIFQNLLNLTNPDKLYDKKTKKINHIYFAGYLEKILKLKTPLSFFFKMLIDYFFISPLKTNENIYKKTFFRTFILSLLINRQLFQKNNDKNFYTNGKLSIVILMFKIAGFKNGKNVGMDNFMLSMFNEDGNYNLKMSNSKNDDNFKIIRFLYDFDKGSKEKILENEKKIFKAINDGFIEK